MLELVLVLLWLAAGLSGLMALVYGGVVLVRGRIRLTRGRSWQGGVARSTGAVMAVVGAFVALVGYVFVAGLLTRWTSELNAEHRQQSEYRLLVLRNRARFDFEGHRFRPAIVALNTAKELEESLGLQASPRTDRMHAVAAIQVGDWAVAERAIERLLGLGRDNPILVADAALFYACCPDDRIRDTSRAERLLVRVESLIGRHDRWRTLEVRACIAADGGAFVEASRLAARALLTYDGLDEHPSASDGLLPKSVVNRRELLVQQQSAFDERNVYRLPVGS